MEHGGNIYGKHIEADYSVNLNPLGTPEEIFSALEKARDRVSIYPDPEQKEVRRCIASLEGVTPDRVLAGSGASQLFLAVVRSLRPKNALIFEPSYGGYEYALDSLGENKDRCIIRHVNTETGLLSLKPWNTREEVPDLVFVCDPVNPTGLEQDEEALYELLDRCVINGTRVILDESFYLMSDKARDPEKRWRASKLTGRYPDLYVIRSLTKILSAPGIRMGYVISDPENIREVKKNLPEWDLSVMAEEAVMAGCRLLGDTDFIDRTLSVLRREREFLMRELSAPGLSVYESRAPYFCFRGPEGLYDALLSRGILIRDCASFYGMNRGIYRIAVKDHGSNREFLRILKEVMGNV